MMIKMNRIYTVVKAGLTAAVLSVCFTLSSSAQDRLLTDLDIPLMAGMEEVEAARVIFDSPEGRIIEARAEGMIEAGKVRDFYRIVLPSLGWKMDQKSKNAEGGMCTVLYCLRAHREAESLTLEISADAQKDVKIQGRTNVVFSLNPE